MSPEGLEIANAYLEKGTIPAVCAELGVSEHEVSEVLNKREVKQYIDTVFLDTGYRNRFKISETLDMLIEKKLEEADETEIYTSKDMADLLQMAHKMRIEELKAQTEMEKAKAQVVKTQVNIQDTSTVFGQGNYGELIKKLMADA
jgi:phage terminase small subunit